MLLYAISRFIIEFYRGDERGTVGMFSTSQFISIVLAPLAIVMLVYLSRRDAEPERAKARALSGRDAACIAIAPSPSPRTATASGSIAFSSSVLPDAVAVADSAADQGRPRAGRRPRGESRTSRSKPGQAIAIDVPEPVDAGAAARSAAAADPLPGPRPRSSSTSRREWSCIRPPGHASGTLVNALLHHVDDLSGIGGEKRPGIVHRLDRGTSGLMVVAKNDAAHEELARQFHDREVEKEYIALVWGEVQAGRRIDAPIGRDPANRKKMSSDARRACASREAVTRIVRAEHFGRVLTLAQVAIHTGRTHQIRVHLSAIGHPIVGDALYGGVHRRVPGDLRAVTHLDRPFLHAARLVFTHPGGRPADGVHERAAATICSACSTSCADERHRMPLGRSRVTSRSWRLSTRAACSPSKSTSVDVSRTAASTSVAIVRHAPSVVLIPIGRRPRRAGPAVPPPLDRESWELPAGSVDEASRRRPRRAASARRRSACVPAQVERLGGFYPTPGFCDEELIFFRVSGLRAPPPDSPHKPDEDEDITAQTVTVAEARAMVEARRDRRSEDRLRLTLI